MNFWKSNLEDTIFALNILIEKKIYIGSTKSIRKILEIDFKNKSKITFIWRSLEYLSKIDVINYLNKTNPKKYKLPKKLIYFNDLKLTPPHQKLLNLKKNTRKKELKRVNLRVNPRNFLFPF